jgi:hypothetical protein
LGRAGSLWWLGFISTVRRQIRIGFIMENRVISFLERIRSEKMECLLFHTSRMEKNRSWFFFLLYVDPNRIHMENILVFFFIRNRPGKKYRSL